MSPADTATIVRNLRDKLPVLSPHAANILRACENPNIDTGALAGMLAGSPSIAASILGLANSSFYSRGKPVFALPKAIQTLGLVTVRGVAIGLVVSSRLSPVHCPAFASSGFWECAVLSAHMAQQLAFKMPPEGELEREAAYMAGLLHNIGLLALASLVPEVMNVLLTTRSSGATPPSPSESLCEQLRAQLGFDHHQVSAWLADAWRFPAPMRHALEHHGERNYRADGWPLVLLTGISARCAHAIVFASTEAGKVARDEAATAAALGLDATDVEHVAARAMTTTDALRTAAEALSRQGK